MYMIEPQQVIDYLKIRGNQAKAARALGYGDDRTPINRIVKGKRKLSRFALAAFYYWFLVSGEGPDDLDRDIEIVVKGQVRKK